MTSERILNTFRSRLNLLLGLLHSRRSSVSIASASFREIVNSQEFWLRHFPFVLWLGVSILILVYLFPLTIPESTDKSLGARLMILLAIFIQPLAILAGVRGLWLLAQFYSEHALALYIIEHGTDTLGKIKGKSISSLKLDDLENYIPFEAAKNRRMLSQIYDDIYRDARDAVFGSPTLILQPYKEHLRTKLSFLTGIQTISLRLGILGTFIGLILGIVNVGGDFFGMISHTNESIEANKVLSMLMDRQGHFESLLKQLFAALYVAFGTSIAGLEVAIVVHVLLLYLRTKQEALFLMVDEATNVIFRLLRNAFNESGLLSSFVQMQESMKGLERRMRSEFDGVSQVHNNLAGKISEQIEITTASLEALRGAKVEWGKFVIAISNAHEKILNDMAQQSRIAKNEFGGFLGTLNAGQQKFINEAKETLDLLSVGKLGKTIEDSIRQVGVQITGTLGNDLHDVSDYIKKHLTTLQSISSAENVLSERLNTLSSTVSTANSNLKVLAEERKEVQAIVERLEKAQQRFGEEVRNAYATATGNPIGQALANDLKRLSSESLAPVVHRLLDLNTLLKALEQRIQSLDRTTREVSSHMPRPVMHYVAVVIGTFLILTVAFFGYFISTQYYGVTFRAGG